MLTIKKIAILTMFFLPGTSFAVSLHQALILWNDFNRNLFAVSLIYAFLQDSNRFWVWIVLTIPCTGLAFAFYLFRKSRNATKDKELGL